MLSPRLYFALGDSTAIGIGGTFGYVDRLTDELRSGSAWRTLNLGENGATSSTVLARQLDRTCVAQPELVTLFVGGNDIWRGVTPASFEANLRAIATRLARTRARVVVGDMVDLSKAPAAEFAERMLGLRKSQIADACASMTAAVRNIARASGWLVAELSRMPVQDEDFCGDGFHPSDVGYARIADAFWPVITRAVLREPR